jgi:hypothetical protein
MSRKQNTYKPKATPEHCLKYVCTEKYRCKTYLCQYQKISPAAFAQNEPDIKVLPGYKCEAFLYKGADRRLYERP